MSRARAFATHPAVHSDADMPAGMLRGSAFAVGFWALGIVLAFHPTLLTGFSRLQGAPVDTRLINYLLEDEYQWLRSGGRHELWNSAFFFPAPNAAAYSDVQLAVMPIYAAWRLLGCPYDTAFQLWTMTALSLDFAAFWFFLRRVAGVSQLAAGFGAFLFAFGAPRVNQVGHEQLFSQFSVVVSLYALCRVFAAHDRGSRPEGGAIWLGVILFAVVVQLYSGFYSGWFWLFALLVTGAWAVALSSWRARVWATLRACWRPLTVALVLTGVALTPLALHYLEAARVVGFRAWSDAEAMLPRPQSWLYLGPFSRLYRWQYDLPLFHTLVADQEHRLGIGVVTTVLVILGLYWRRRDAGTRLLVLVAATIALCTTVPIGEWSWHVVFAVVPGANAIRAVARIGILMLIPAGIGVAYFIDAIRPRRWLLAAALTASVLEQVQTTPSYDKRRVRSDVAALAAQIDGRCDAFLFTPLGAAVRSGFEDGKHHLDAMWAQLLTGVPTINGLSGNAPPGWDFTVITLRDEAGVRAIERSLQRWRQRWDLSDRQVCWLRTPVDWSWASNEPLYDAVLHTWHGAVSP